MNEKKFLFECSDGWDRWRYEDDLNLEQAIEAVMYFDENLLYKKDRNFITIMIDSLQPTGYLDFGKFDHMGYIIIRRIR